MIDIRQSPLYVRFMQSLGWKIKRIGTWQAFIRPFPLIGSFIKIQRIGNPFPEKEIKELARKHRAFRVIIEPEVDLRLPTTEYRQLNTIFSPSKTILIDLSPSEKTIFNRFSESKRRAVRRAENNKIIVKQSNNIDEFIKLKSRQMFPLGFLLSEEISLLWQNFSPAHASLLLAHQHPSTNPLAGVLILFWKKKAYYWLASATNEGKKLFAPTLLVWESLKLAKNNGCVTFDFEGIFDPRFPKSTNNWKGFTKFKQGFGGKEVEYPKPITLPTRGR